MIARMPVSLLTPHRQRVIAELLEHGMRSTLLLPIHRPSLMDAPITMPSQQGDALTSLGINPAHALQHPAFYYYMSARYTEKRREMFAAALELEVSWDPQTISPRLLTGYKGSWCWG